MPLTALERLRCFLRPAGNGLHTSSTGGGHAKLLHRALYETDQPKEVAALWEDNLQKVRRAEVILLGVPSDVGAGLLRGANLGPVGVRLAYLKKYGKYKPGVVDLGDIICVPHLLHDEMLSGHQIEATRRQLYPDVDESLPVSALSVTQAALLLLAELNPNAKLALIGGDHSISWPSMLWCQKKYGNQFAVLHIDAHTDLLDVRLGVKYCFATWAYHALQLLKPQHLVQIGIRVSSQDKAFWTEHFPIQQIWANEVPFQEAGAIQRIVDHFKAQNVHDLFISNDIDGTDAGAAPATGAPEVEGLSPEFVSQLIARMGEEFNLIGGDLMEVAPPLAGTRDFANEKTCEVGADYLHVLLQSF